VEAAAPRASAHRLWLACSQVNRRHALAHVRRSSAFWDTSSFVIAAAALAAIAMSVAARPLSRSDAPSPCSRCALATA
jgi:hypothetical protein